MSTKDNLKITVNKVIAWNGGTEEGLAEYLIWAIDNPEIAKRDLTNYGYEEV